MVVEPVCYEGFVFRSTLESKWARLFDELGVFYEYEPKVFDTSLGWYLPDFYLPRFELWVEVKPSEPTDEERQKLIEACDQVSQRGVFVSSFPEFDAGGPKNFGVHSLSGERLRCDKIFNQISERRQAQIKRAVNKSLGNYGLVSAAEHVPVVVVQIAEKAGNKKLRYEINAKANAERRVRLA